LIVVSDASPLISLAAIRRLGLLRELYGEVQIPQEVRREIGSLQDGSSADPSTGLPDWIVSSAIRDQVLVRALGETLDQGEAEAIVLTIELGADLLLMDERRGRQAAKRLNLNVVGVLGVLLEAKSKGILQEVRPVLDELLNRAGFRISRLLHDEVLRLADEIFPAEKH
jgi:predicted nucleic acid-binding protein